MTTVLDPGTSTAPRTTGVLTDIRNVWWRETLTIVRDPFSLIFSLLQPLVFLGLFGPLLSGIAGDAGAFGGSSLMIGRALKELTPLVVQAAIVTLVAVPFGFALYPLHVLAGLVLLGIFGVGIGALSYALAIAARKTEWIFWAVQQSLLFPLLILSGMMLPLETGPGWMRIASLVNPLTYIVDAERALFAGSVADPAVLWGLIAALVTAAVGLTVGVRAIRGATI